MNAPLVEFLRRFRERERENAARSEISLPYPILLDAQAPVTRSTPMVQSPSSSRSGRPNER